MRALTKKQRNALYDQIVTAGLDPALCDFADDEQDVRLTHNAPFGPAEQSRIAAQLREVKDYLADRYPLSDEEISEVEVRLDEVAAATHRAGRKDWLLMFYGVMFTLIVTALLPPDAVQRIMAMVSHGLGDLFGF
jgi:hypothetical protein